MRAERYSAASSDLRPASVIEYRKGIMAPRNSSRTARTSPFASSPPAQRRRPEWLLQGDCLTPFCATPSPLA